MAAHYRDPGHTPVVPGATYVQFLRYAASWNEYRLRRMDPATRMCVMVARSGYVRYVSEGDLTHWHMVRMDQQ